MVDYPAPPMPKDLTETPTPSKNHNAEIETNLQCTELKSRLPSMKNPDMCKTVKTAEEHDEEKVQIKLDRITTNDN